MRKILFGLFFVANVLLLAGNLVWVWWNAQSQPSSARVSNRVLSAPSDKRVSDVFLDARVAFLKQMKERATDGKTQEALDQALTRTHKAQSVPPEQLTLEEIFEVEKAFLAAMEEWAVDRLVKEKRVPLLPTFAKAETRQILVGQMFLLRGNAKVFPDSPSIVAAIRIQEAGLALLDKDELTLLTFLECCRVVTLENAKATKALLEELNKRRQPEV